MSRSIIIFFFLSLFFLSSTSSSLFPVNTTRRCSIQQTRALLQFKQNLFSINDTMFMDDFVCESWLGSGYNPIMMNWNTSIDCCDWNGVTCDRSTGDVIGLDLSCGMVKGTIHPNTTLFHLPRLQRLNLAYNNFTGSQLPPDVAKVSNSLTHLNIRCSGLTGQVPRDISHLHKLMSLDLSLNEIDFSLEPHVFINLLHNTTAMTKLSLYGVDISSVLPNKINISSSLKWLDLGSTGLHGNLYNNLFNLQSLEQLDLSGNGFTGHIPSEIPLLPKLVSLDLSSNEIDNLLIQPHIFYILLKNSTILRELWLARVNMDFVLPTYLNISSPLRSLDLSFTNLQGKLPDNILNLKYLEELFLLGNKNLFGPLPKINTSTSTPLWWLDLSFTSLSGEIPTSIGHLSSLYYLNFSYCGFNGSLPKSISNLRNLVFLYLSSNMLSGTLPSSLFTLPSLNYIMLDNNMFQGNMPLELFSLQSLRILSLANNQLTGQIDVLDQLTNLIYIDLSNNSISGTIPNVYKDWSALESYILNGNQLEGKVPTSISKCQNLRIIDFGNNHLNDTFPSWLGDLPKLQVLILRSNNLHGGIVTSSMLKFPFPSLRVLDLSHNEFVGQLPTNYFQNFKAMKNVVKNNTKPEYVLIGRVYYSVTIVMKGVHQHFPRLLVGWTIVDLSNNKFEGEIPNIMGNLSSLKVLNLSHNCLRGLITHDLGKISELESLDLSWNQLIGEIPQTLADLTFLEILNLSQNHLVGSIPHGKQFKTFEENSFRGNPKLCGYPLPKKCTEHLQEPQLGGDEDEDKEESEFTWKVVMMGYGCGTLLGFVLGYIML